MKLALPPSVAGTFNPAMWDKVVEGPTFVSAICVTKSGQEKFKYMGWSDAIDGKAPRFNNQWYKSGYMEGQMDLVGL